MTSMWVELAFMLLVILVAAEVFTNALEHLGEKLGISEGITGSIFAAVATALPETLVPLLAIIAGTPNQQVNEEISVGAILGAPLMLSTLSTSLMAWFAIKQRGLRGKIKPERVGLLRDLHFFMIAFTLSALAMFIPQGYLHLRPLISIMLVGLYVSYLLLTCKASKKLVVEGHGVTSEAPLYLSRMGCKNNSMTIGMQLGLGLILLLLGAKGFIHGVEGISKVMAISALLLSLLVIPLATELPEKINSILWIRKNKDTLAFGNITGALVFQGTLLPALGILLTPWQPSKFVLIGFAVTFLAIFWVRYHAKPDGLHISALLVNGLFYLTYLVCVLLPQSI